MSKTMIWVIGVVILVVVGGGMFFANGQSQQAQEAKMAEEKASMQAKEVAVMEKDGKMMDDNMTKGGYVEYSKKVLDEASNNRRVLFFFANWCPTCKPTDADLKTNTSKIPQDVTVIRVNYNDTDTDQEEKDLAKKYGITYQHTFVQIDGQGNEVTKWNGGKTDELLANIK